MSSYRQDNLRGLCTAFEPYSRPSLPSLANFPNTPPFLSCTVTIPILPYPRINDVSSCPYPIHFLSNHCIRASIHMKTLDLRSKDLELEDQSARWGMTQFGDRCLMSGEFGVCKVGNVWVREGFRNRNTSL